MSLKQLSFIVFFLIIFFGCISNKEDSNTVTHAKKNIDEIPWQAHWIATQDSLPEKNAWIAFRKQFEVADENVPSLLRMAVDTKYWLYLNGQMILFEGGLKRGPTPDDTYYDEIALNGKLRKGKNTIAVLLWYFGKDGMTHKSSGTAGLIAELFQGDTLLVQTDDSWKAIPHPGYISESKDPQPNWRLPESNVLFDARKDIPGWVQPTFSNTDWPSAKILGKGIAQPWNKLVKRPIPFWKDLGLTSYPEAPKMPFTSTGDTIVCKLPYNGQFTPYLKIKSKSGAQITMLTDNYKGGSAYNMRAEYVTKTGEQSYESLGWINGHEMYYVIPKGVDVLDLKYRETGYNTEFSGSITVNDDFYNQLCKKAVRTLYVTMRDNYMDTPGRERAQWWGDVVLESGEAFYALGRSSDALMRKGMLELMNWQRPDSTIFSPIPTGVWDQELPGQMLSSVGYYGFWNYYMHTGDLGTIEQIYEPVKKYLGVWKLKSDGTLKLRKGGWTWSDWGENKDVALIQNTQYYMALRGFALMARALGKEKDSIQKQMVNFKNAFNKAFWKGGHYQSSDYKGETDDRSQGLAVVAGLADPNKYEALYKVLQKERHASPYMEKYVLEALFQMGYPDYALQRMKERFSKMVLDTTYTTLWEGWGIGAEGYGGGTTNHAWSGGGLTLLYQYAAGIAPTSPGWETFQVRPQPGFLKELDAEVSTVKGKVKVSLQQGDTYSLKVTIPEDTRATVYVPATFANIKVDGEKVSAEQKGSFRGIELDPGTYLIEADGS